MPANLTKHDIQILCDYSFEIIVSFLNIKNTLLIILSYILAKDNLF